ncbi:hypothetical protein [uncultured Haemophilus sp.]
MIYNSSITILQYTLVLLIWLIIVIKKRRIFFDCFY